METTLVNIRLENAEVEVLDRMAGRALNRQAVARMLLIAAIEAVEKNQGQLSFPPKLVIESKGLTTQPIDRFNQPPLSHKGPRK